MNMTMYLYSCEHMRLNRRRTKCTSRRASNTSAWGSPEMVGAASSSDTLLLCLKPPVAAGGIGPAAAIISRERSAGYSSPSITIVAPGRLLSPKRADDLGRRAVGPSVSSASFKTPGLDDAEAAFDALSCRAITSDGCFVAILSNSSFGSSHSASVLSRD